MREAAPGLERAHLPDPEPALPARLQSGQLLDTGAPLTYTSAAGITLGGQVLYSQPPTHLSVTIEDPSGCCTYLTWHLRAACAGTVIRLTVEEPGGEPEDLEQLEDAWLPALQALEDVLQG